MKNKFIYLMVICLTVLIACSNQEKSSKKQTSSTVSKNTQMSENIIVKVNGRGITADEFIVFKDEFSKGHPQHGLSDSELLQKNIDYELWAMEARSKALTRDPDNQLRVKLLSKVFYAKKARERFLQTHLITPQMIQKEYNKRYHEQGKKMMDIPELYQVKTEIIDYLKQQELNRHIRVLNIEADITPDSVINQSKIEFKPTTEQNIL